MWNKLKLILLFTFLVVFSWSQDDYFDYNTEINKFYRAGASIKLALVPHRTLYFPEETIGSSFYKKHFILAGEPSSIEEPTASFQLGGNLAWIVTSKNKHVAFEFGIDFGYQNSGQISDRIYKTITTQDTTYISAEIDVDYKLHELYLGGYALAKTNSQFVDVFIGLGLSVYNSVGSAFVTHSLFEIPVDSYKTAMSQYTRVNPYIPFGLEIPFTQEENRVSVKLMGSLRREVHKDNFQPNRFFLTAGFQFQYQF